MEQINILKSRLEQTIAAFPKQVNSLAETTLRDKPSADKWSKVEILGHLVDSALNNHQRWIRVLQGESLTLNYNQDKWVLLQDYQHTPVSDVLTLWILVNKQLIRLMGSMTLHSKDLPYNDGQKEVTLQYLIQDYLVHLEHHIGQIK